MFGAYHGFIFLIFTYFAIDKIYNFGIMPRTWLKVQSAFQPMLK